MLLPGHAAAGCETMARPIRSDLTARAATPAAVATTLGPDPPLEKLMPSWH